MMLRIEVILLSIFFAGCNSRHIAAEKVPSVVRNTLAANYPAVNNVDWAKHNNYYEAEADLNDSIEMEMQIDEAGTIIMKKLDIAIDNLPATVLNYVQTNFKTYEIDDAELLEKKSIKYYQVELSANGKRDIHLVFTQEGILSKDVSFWD